MSGAPQGSSARAANSVLLHTHKANGWIDHYSRAVLRFKTRMGWSALPMPLTATATRRKYVK